MSNRLAGDQQLVLSLCGGQQHGRHAGADPNEEAIAHRVHLGTGGKVEGDHIVVRVELL